MLELHPSVGVGTLQFGDPISAAKIVFGASVARDHPTEQLRISLQYPDIGLLLYFSEEDALVDIIVDGDSDSFSLMGSPLPEIFGDSPPYSDRIREWIEGNNLMSGAPRSFMGCWHYEVEGKYFSFALPEEGAPTVNLRSGT
jgi:hypothetical protein